MVTRHEFLAQLHQLLKPKIYLEIGVQTGASLALATYSQTAIGIDPEPLMVETGNQAIFKMRSDDFFKLHAPPDVIDLAFIDGSHLFEDAMRDFLNVMEHCHSGSVVVFDDVLPYSQAIAERVQPPGDWTGDVWKVACALHAEFGDCLYMELVDTSPTGSLVVWGFHEHDILDGAVLFADRPDTVPDEIINRIGVRQPQEVLDSVAFYLDLIKEKPCVSQSLEEQAS